VIGGQQNSSSAVLNSLGLGTGSGAVRPAAKTLMDLIQEDFPPESPVDAGDLYCSEFQQGSSYSMERPRTTSPLSSQNHSIRRSDHFLYPGQDDNDLLDSLGRLRMGLGGDPTFPARNGTVSDFYVDRFG
jgi:hypothetical protein